MIIIIHALINNLPMKAVTCAVVLYTCSVRQLSEEESGGGEGKEEAELVPSPLPLGEDVGDSAFLILSF